MARNIHSLSSSELTNLGGLRLRCSSPLCCVEHGLQHPCELCELDGLTEVVCTGCGQPVDQGLLGTEDRPCESIAVFKKTGRIAFEIDAVNALAAFEMHFEADAKRIAEEKERIQKKREEQRRAEAEKLRREADEETERLRMEEIARIEQARALAESDRQRKLAEEADAALDRLFRRRSTFAAWVSFLSAIAGASLAWRMPSVDMPSRSWEFIAGYACIVLIVWGAGAASLCGKERTQLNLRAWAWLPWAYMTFIWPAFAGLTVCLLFDKSISVIFVYVGVVIAAIYCIKYGGAAFTMKPPWPKAGVVTWFKGLRSGWMYMGFLVTTGLNGAGLAVITSDKPTKPPQTTMQAATLVTPRNSSMAASASAPVKPLETAMPEVSNPQDRAAAMRHLGALINAVTNASDFSAKAAPGTLPAVDDAISALSALPKPEQGNHKLARYLLTSLGQKNSDLQALDILIKAHEADPRDVQVVNDLAYAELKVGKFAVAAEHLMQTLILAPTRSSAWVNLAEVRVASAPMVDEAIDQAVDYYVVAYWFSRNRTRTVDYLRETAGAAIQNPRRATAAQKALIRLGMQ